MQKIPYKFLDSYSKEDKAIFFGREREIEELYSKVFDSRILILYGVSGTGKSSLINCGLANKFNDSDWLPITIRRGQNINQSLYESLEKNLLTDIIQPGKSPGTVKINDIIKIIRSVYLDHFKPIYLIFDQFEELFIFGNSIEKSELINSIKKVADSDLQCRFIFSIREEYLAGVTEFEKVIPTFFSNRIRIEKMTRQNAIQVIEGPCRLNGIIFESGFPEKLLDKLNPNSPEVELTWLQVFLDKILRLASTEGNDVTGISCNLLDSVGDVKDLLGDFLDEQISQMDDPETGLMILKSFVSVKGTRHQITENEIIDQAKTFGNETDRETVRNYVQKFIRLRILRDKDDNNRYELRHDSLAAKIFEEITLVEKELIEIKQFLENALNSYEKRGLLLTADDLNYIAPYEEKLFLNDRIIKFITESKKTIHRAKRRRQKALIISAVSLITILSFFSIWALKERGNAIDQRKIADEQKNTAISAKEAADSARQEAVIARNLAVEKERQAILAQEQSEASKKEALAEREYALQQKNRAEMLSLQASEQAQIATGEKLKAEQEKTKAIIAEEEAKRFSLLSTAQNLALKSTGIEKNPELAGLLAVQAYIFNNENKGHPEDQVIYEALSKAFAALDSSHHSVFNGSPSEVRVLTERGNGSLISLDMDGVVKNWNPDGYISESYSLPFSSQSVFISSNSSGKKVVTQHENKEMLVWDNIGNTNSGIILQKTEGYPSLIRSVAFSENAELLAVAAGDSSLLIYDLNNKALIINSLTTGSTVRALAFCSKDSLLAAQDDGSIVLYDLKNKSDIILFSSDSERPLSLAWNSKAKSLAAGFSNGNLCLFKLIDSRFMQHETYVVHASGIDLLTYNKDLTLLATASWDKTIRFFNYGEFFDRNNTFGGSRHITDLNLRVRSMIFTGDNKLAAGLSDKSIRVWETSSEKLATSICNIVKRDMTTEEWDQMVGTEIPYQNTCIKNP